MSSFRFRKKTEYGLMMMAVMANAGDEEYVSVAKMQENGMPRSFLVKIARDLIKAKLIVAREGRGGGYILARKAEKITLQNVVEAIEGEVATASCLVHGAKKCPLAEMCPHRGMMRKLTDEINDLLKKYHLSEFAK